MSVAAHMFDVTHPADLLDTTNSKHAFRLIVSQENLIPTLFFSKAFLESTSGDGRREIMNAFKEHQEITVNMINHQ